MLWFVGDYASLDARNQRNTMALARLLQAAGVDVGDPLRRRAHGRQRHPPGRRGGAVPERSPRRTSRADHGCDFNRILTSDPHTFNTLRNEYPALGAPWTAEQVVHHSQLLLELARRRIN